jgi:hypothetical protein
VGPGTTTTTDGPHALLANNIPASQSNMNTPLSYVFNGTAEIAAANHPNIHLFTVPDAAVPNCEGGQGADCGPATGFPGTSCGIDPHTNKVHHPASCPFTTLFALLSPTHVRPC